MANVQTKTTTVPVTKTVTEYVTQESFALTLNFESKQEISILRKILQGIAEAQGLSSSSPNVKALAQRLRKDIQAATGNSGSYYSGHRVSTSPNGRIAVLKK